MSIRSFLMSAALACAALLPNAARADDPAARTQLMALWAKMFDAKDLAFSAKIATTDKKGRTMHSEMRANWPDKFHIKSEESEFIVIGESTWMRPQGQGWMKFPMSMSKMIAAYKPEMMKASMEGTTNVQHLRDEDLNGKPTSVFSYDYDMKVMGIRSTGTSTLWLEQASGYPLRIESDGEAMNMRSKTVVEYAYDPNIKIGPPN